MDNAEQQNDASQVDPSTINAKPDYEGSPKEILSHQESDATGGTVNPNLSASSSSLGEAEKNVPTGNLNNSKNKKPNAANIASSAMPKNTLALAAKAVKVFWNTPTKKGVSIGGCVVGAAGVVGIIMAILAPMKIISITQNLQDEAFATAESAVSDTTENMLGRYLIHQVMPGMVDGMCPSTRVEKSCAKVAKGTNPVSQLYNTWRDARLENKLATKYGVEIIRMGPQSNSNFYIRTPGISENTPLGRFDDIIKYDDNLWANIQSKDKNKIRRELREAFSNETLWKKMWYRHKVTTLLAKKYGVPRCFAACDTVDKINDLKKRKVTDRVQTYKGKFAKMAFSKADESTSIIFECLLSNFDCADFKDVDQDGNRSTNYEEKLIGRLRELDLRGVNTQEMVEKLDKIKRIGVVGYGVENLVAKFGVRLSEKFIPFVGWIDLGVLAMQGSQHIGPMIRGMNYAYKAGIMASWWITFRSMADEQKAGKTDLAALGVMTRQISGEGGLTAEQSPLYQKLFSTNTNTVVANIFSPNTYAAQTASEFLQEICDEKPDEGSTICKNESLSAGADSAIARSASFVSNGWEVSSKLPTNWLANKAIDTWSWLSNGLSGIVGSVVDGIVSLIAPAAAEKWFDENMAKITKSIAEWVMKIVVSSPYSQTPNAVNNFVLIVGGALETASKYFRDGLGAQAATDEEAQAVKNKYLAEQREVFKEKSIFARLADADSRYSLKSQLALSIPTINSSFTTQYAANVMRSPFIILGSIFSSFGGSQASASSSVASDFGIQQYIVKPISGDFETMWDTYNCSDLDQKKKWTEDHSYINDQTGQLVITEQNNCKVLESSIQSAGGMFNANLLPKDPASSATSQISSASTESNGWVWPIAGAVAEKVTHGWGEWYPPKNGTHKAIDIGGSNKGGYGASVLAAHNGIVKESYKDANCNYFYLIEATGTGYWMTYQHLQDLPTNKPVGATVTAGEEIGKVGHVGGCGSGDHLHFGIEKGPKMSFYSSNLADSVDPLTILPGKSNTSNTTNIDGFVWPVDIGKADVINIVEKSGVNWSCNKSENHCHHNNTAAFDLMHKDGNTASEGKAVFAVTSGKIYNAHIYKGKAGCYSFHIKAPDGWDYYYTHVGNAIITSAGQSTDVTAGQKIAEIGSTSCGDGTAHLHIDRGSPKGRSGGETNNRDSGFEDIIVNLHNNLP